MAKVLILLALLATTCVVAARVEEDSILADPLQAESNELLMSDDEEVPKIPQIVEEVNPMTGIRRAPKFQVDFFF